MTIRISVNYFFVYTISGGETDTGKLYLSQRQIAGVMAGVMTGVLLSALDSTIVGTAMPKIVESLRGMDRYSWPFTSYMMFSTGAAVIFGNLADIYGRKTIFLSGLLVFILGSVFCGWSSSMLALILFRGMQGIGGGILISIAFAITGELFQGKERGKAMGMVGSMFGLASILGPALGGLITDHFGWRWIFFINIPIGTASIVLIARNLPGITEEKMKRRIDFAGMAGFIAFLLPLLLALSWCGHGATWNSPLIMGLLAVSCISSLVFIGIESRAREPVLPLWLFKSRVFNFTMIGAFCSNAVFFGAILFLPLYIQEVQKTSAAVSGFLLTPMMVAFTVASVLCGQIASQTGKTKALSLVGFFVTLVGCLMLSFLSHDTSRLYCVLAMMILGLGLGTNTPIFNLNVQIAFPMKMMGLLTGTVQFFRNVGGTMGVAVFGTLFMHHLQSGTSKLNWGGTPDFLKTILSDPKILMDSHALEGVKETVPQAYQSVMGGIFHQLEGLLSSAVASMFIVASVAAAIALLSGVFQEECRLKEGSSL